MQQQKCWKSMKTAHFCCACRQTHRRQATGWSRWLKQASRVVWWITIACRARPAVWEQWAATKHTWYVACCCYVSIPFTLFVYWLLVSRWKRWSSRCRISVSRWVVRKPLTPSWYNSCPTTNPLAKAALALCTKWALLLECFVVVVHWLFYAGENKRYGFGVGCEAARCRRVDWRIENHCRNGLPSFLLFFYFLFNFSKNKNNCRTLCCWFHLIQTLYHYLAWWILYIDYYYYIILNKYLYFLKNIIILVY